PAPGGRRGAVRGLLGLRLHGPGHDPRVDPGPLRRARRRRLGLLGHPTGRPPPPEDRCPLDGRQGPPAARQGGHGGSLGGPPGHRQIRPDERERRPVRLVRRRVLSIPSGRPSRATGGPTVLSPVIGPSPRASGPSPSPSPPPPPLPRSLSPPPPLEVPVLAIVCPGQGAQKPGFLTPWRELPGPDEALAALSAPAGIDLLRHGTESDADTLRDTAVAQPLLVAAGIVAAAALYQEEGLPAADAFAGHSVGELTAAALGGVLSNEDAMRLVAVRSQAMAR